MFLKYSIPFCLWFNEPDRKFGVCVPCLVCQVVVNLSITSLGQTVYKVVINDTTPASTPLFIIDVVGSPSDYTFLATGEMATGFIVDGNGVVSINQPMSIGRYEFILSALYMFNDLYTAIALVDVISLSELCVLQ